MHIAAVFGIGYLCGCISPAAILGKTKHIDLRQEGTKNLGATNTGLVLGAGSGFLVLIADILKSILSAMLSAALFPKVKQARMIAGIGCLLGHCFPIFMNFRGGKGVAVFAGMVLLYDVRFAVPIVVIGTALIFVLNTGVAAPILACVLFPMLVAWKNPGSIDIVLASTASLIVLLMHTDNIRKALTNRDVISTRDYFRKLLK